MYRNRGLLEWVAELGSDLAERRATAAVALAEIGNPSEPVLTALQAIKHDPDPRVRRAVAAALAGDPTPEPVTIPILVELLSDPVEHVRARAAHSLRGLGRAGIVALTRVTEHGERDAKLAALGWLRDVSEADLASACVTALEPLLASDDDSLVELAVRSLGSLGPAAGPAVPALIGVARAGSRLREQALLALASIGVGAVRHVLLALEGGEPWAVEKAGTVLGWVDWDVQDRAELAAVLIEAMQSSEPRVVLHALDAVAVTGSHDAATVAELERLAAHSDARVRAAAKQLLRKSAMPDTPVPRR